jgi:hypothetical protein
MSLFNATAFELDIEMVAPTELGVRCSCGDSDLLLSDE